jgi:hypothetical protein
MRKDTQEAVPTPEEDAPMLPDEMEAIRAMGGGTCYSAKNCTGKILNKRDAHNCKNSGGKSWLSPDGTCYNL